MTDIEKRAWEKYPSEYESSLYYTAEDDPNVYLREAYIKGACEQKAIDDGYIAELEDALVQTPCYEEGFEEGYTVVKKEIIDNLREWIWDNSYVPFDYYNDCEGKEEDRVVEFYKLLEWLKSTHSETQGEV